MILNTPYGTVFSSPVLADGALNTTQAGITTVFLFQTVDNPCDMLVYRGIKGRGIPLNQ